MLCLVTARKPHICESCERKILAGDKYWNNYNPYIDPEAEPQMWYEHTNCELFRDKAHDPN